MNPYILTQEDFAYLANKIKKQKQDRIQNITDIENSLIVQIKDQYGNVQEKENGVVTLNLSSGAPTSLAITSVSFTVSPDSLSSRTISTGNNFDNIIEDMILLNINIPDGIQDGQWYITTGQKNILLQGTILSEGTIVAVFGIDGADQYNADDLRFKGIENRLEIIENKG